MLEELTLTETDSIYGGQNYYEPGSNYVPTQEEKCSATPLSHIIELIRNCGPLVPPGMGDWRKP